MAGLLDSIIGDDTTKDEYGTTQADRRMPIWSGMINAGLLALAGGQKMMPEERAQYIAKIGGAISGVPEQMMAQRSDAAKQTLQRQQIEVSKQTLDANKYKLAQQQSQRAYFNSPEFNQQLADPRLPATERAIIKADLLSEKPNYDMIQKMLDPKRWLPKIGENSGLITEANGDITWVHPYTGVTKPIMRGGKIVGTVPTPDATGGPPGTPPAVQPGTPPIVQPGTPPPPPAQPGPPGSVQPPPPPPALTGGGTPQPQPPPPTHPPGPVVAPPVTQPSPNVVATPQPAVVPPQGGGEVPPHVRTGARFDKDGNLIEGTLNPSYKTFDESNFADYNPQVLADLNKNDPSGNMAREVQAISQYIQPGKNEESAGRGAGGLFGIAGQNKAIMDAVRLYTNNTYNRDNFKFFNDLRREYSIKGTTGKNMVGIDTLAGHTGALRDAIAAVNPNDDAQVVNTLRNAFGLQFGGKEVVALNAAKLALSEEMSRVFKGANVSDHDVEQWKGLLNNAQTKGQWQGVIDMMQRLVTERSDAVTNKFVQDHGGRRLPMSFINEKNKAKLEWMTQHPLDADEKAAAGTGAGTLTQQQIDDELRKRGVIK